MQGKQNLEPRFSSSEELEPQSDSLILLKYYMYTIWTIWNANSDSDNL